VATRVSPDCTPQRKGAHKREGRKQISAGSMPWPGRCSPELAELRALQGALLSCYFLFKIL
jgi:hypothetical protein